MESALSSRGTSLAQQRNMTAIHPDEILVSDVMVKNVVCVTRDLPISKLEALLLDRGISGVPVTDDDGRPIGVISKTDLLRAGRQGSLSGDTRVGDLMMPTALCIGTDETIAKTAGLMAFEGVHRVPVISPEGRVVGLVSALDVLRWLARESGYPIGNRP